MKNTSHTPGPWRVTNHTPTLDAAKFIKVESKDRVIADGFKGDEANARLIAAAPELLESLVALYLLIDAHSGRPPIDRLMVAQNDAREAIAKATNA